MINNSSGTIPLEVSSLLEGRDADFIVKSEKAYSRRQILPAFLFSIGLIIFTCFFFAIFFGPLLQGKEVNFESNGQPVTASLDNLSPLILPGFVIGTFLVAGLSILITSIYKLLKKGGYFIGTPQNLVIYQDGNIRTIDWEQFSGDISLSQSNGKGNIALQLRTGNVITQKNKSSRIEPEVIYIVGIKNAVGVERICRQRIKENDPTPANQ